MTRRAYYEQVEEENRQRLNEIAREAGLSPETPPGILGDYLAEQGQEELGQEVRDLDPAAQPIRSNKKLYEVGERHKYIYYLVKDSRSLEDQQQAAARLSAEHGLTADEQQGLADLLEKFNRRFRPYWLNQQTGQPPKSPAQQAQAATPKRPRGRPRKGA